MCFPMEMFAYDALCLSATVLLVIPTPSCRSLNVTAPETPSLIRSSKGPTPSSWIHCLISFLYNTFHLQLFLVFLFTLHFSAGKGMKGGIVYVVPDPW